MLLKSQARHVQHMQKALTQMNVQLANVISDVVGETGQKILRAIVAGERDGHVLGAMKNVRVHASVEEIAKSLQGNWRSRTPVCAQAGAGTGSTSSAPNLAECDREIEAQLQSLHTHDGEPAKGKKRGRSRNAPKFDLRVQLFKMCGVDLTRIDGVDVTTALAVVSRDRRGHVTLPHRQALHQLAGLVPGYQDHRRQGDERQDQALSPIALRRPCAWPPPRCARSQSALGAYFRRMCSRMDKPKAVTAAAHKLARLIYTMLTKGQEYTDQGQDYYEQRYRERVLRPCPSAPPSSA